MRNNLRQLLRRLEEEGDFQNSYADRLGEPPCDYTVTEHLDFPNYRLVVRRYNETYPLSKHHGQQPVVLGNSIKGELKRMELDELLMIGTQRAVKYAHTDSKCGPDYDEGASSTTEAIVLTTKGKSGWRYFWHKATDNPVNTILSVVAIVISVFALFL